MAIPVPLDFTELGSEVPRLICHRNKPTMGFDRNSSIQAALLTTLLLLLLFVECSPADLNFAPVLLPPQGYQVVLASLLQVGEQAEEPRGEGTCLRPLSLRLGVLTWLCCFLTRS